MDSDTKTIVGGESTSAKRKLTKTRNKWLYIAVAATCIVILLVAGHIIQNAMRSRRSHNLTLQINNLEKSSTCDQGLKQINPLAGKLSDSNQYNNATREQGLGYLMSCNIISGNKQAALNYANELIDLYKQEGASSKAQEVSQYTKYIESLQ